ncbi:hypothetical protein BC835DRAFT_1416127 [Cytidiella melzeri]|nr:hypothetical protein BC835DRAFT_1416127 [Cytidiella melzeri]
MAKLCSEQKLRFQQEHMEVDNKALLSYSRPTKVSAAKGSSPKAKKTLDLICVAPSRASHRERGGAVSDAMTSADEGGAASEAKEIMTPGARKSYANATKAKGKNKAPAKSLFEGMHPSVALSYCQHQAAAAKKVAASAPTSTTAPPAAAGEISLGKHLRADSTHNMEHPDTPSTAALPAKKPWTADDWFNSLSVEMINNFALRLQVLGSTAVDFSIDQILAAGQRMGSFGFPNEGTSAPATQDKGKGKTVVPGTHPTNNTKPDARANFVREPKPKAPVVHAPRPPESKTTVVITFDHWQLAEHKKKGGMTSTVQPKLNPVIRVKWDEKRQNQLQLAFQVRLELNFVNWLEDVWKNVTSENIAGYILSSTYPPILMVHMYTSMAELVIQACPSKGLLIQDIFEEVLKYNPEVFQHLVPSDYTPIAFWGAGHKKGSLGPLHIFAYDVGGEVTQHLIQEKVTIGSKKCSLDHEGNIPMRELTLVAGPSRQRERVKSGRYEALSEVAETSEDDVEIVGAGTSEMEDGQHE